jgi:hypothetical protein
MSVTDITSTNPITVINQLQISSSTTQFTFDSSKGFKVDKRFQFSLTSSVSSTPTTIDAWYHDLSPASGPSISTIIPGSNLIVGILKSVDQTGFAVTRLGAKLPSASTNSNPIQGTAEQNNLIIVPGLTPGTEYNVFASSSTLTAASSNSADVTTQTTSRLGDLTPVSSSDFTSTTIQGIKYLAVPTSATIPFIFAYTPSASVGGQGTVYTLTKGTGGQITAVAGQALSAGFSQNSELQTIAPSFYITPNNVLVTIDQGIDTFSVNTSSGSVSQVAHMKNGEYQGFVPYTAAMSPDGSYILSAGFNPNNANDYISAIRRIDISEAGQLSSNASGSFTDAGSYSSSALLKGWYSPVQLSNGTDSSFAYPQRMIFTHDGAQAIILADALYTFDPTGSTASNKIKVSSLSSECVNTIASEGTRADIALSPADDYLYVFCKDSYYTYSRNKQTMALTLVSSVFTQTNQWSPVKYNVEATDTLTGSIYTSTYIPGVSGQETPYQAISSFTRDNITGILYLQQIFASESTPLYADPADIKFTPDGNYVYVAQPGPVGGSGKVALFSRTGGLQNTGTVDTAAVLSSQGNSESDGQSTGAATGNSTESSSGSSFTSTQTHSSSSGAQISADAATGSHSSASTIAMTFAASVATLASFFVMLM